jgi:hypothetical protein
MVDRHLPRGRKFNEPDVPLALGADFRLERNRADRQIALIASKAWAVIVMPASRRPARQQPHASRSPNADPQ